MFLLVLIQSAKQRYDAMVDDRENAFQPKDVMRVKNDSGVEDVYYSIFYQELPPEYVLLAEQVLGETSANKEEGLSRLKEFMKKEDLSCTEDVLILVLRSCKYNIKKSESKLKRFLRTRQLFIDRLCQIDEKKIERILNDDICSVLPYRDKHGRAVIFTKPNHRLDQYSMEDVEAVAMCFVLYLLNFPLSTVCGISYIAECKCESILIYYPIVNSFRKTFARYMFDMPIRYGRADVLNENILIRIFCNALRFILPKKLSDRYALHGDSYKSLHTIYDPNILTKELHGNLEPMHKDIFIERFRKFLQNVREKGEY